MLELNNLTKYYNKNLAVDNLSLKVNKGEIFGFIGPNGAGKSTTINSIMRLVNKTTGKIIIDNEVITNKSYKYKENIGYLPSEIYLYDDLKVKDVFKYANSFYKKDCTKKINELVTRLNIDTNKHIEDLSLGNLKKVGIVLALMHNPKILILDEATSGLDPLIQEEFYKILLEEKSKGKTIFFSSHNLTEVKRICDRVGIIKESKLIKVENIKDIINNYLNIITITSKDINKFKDKFNIINEVDNTIKFTYNEDVNKLINLLNKYKINKLLIEEASLEEVFKHYYE